MKIAIAILVFLAALFGGFFLLSRVESTPLTITTKTISEKTPQLAIDVSYPETSNQNINSAVNDYINEQVTEIKKIRTNSMAVQPNVPYVLQIIYKTTLNTNQAVSFLFTQYQYTGGANGSETYKGMNFSLPTGTPITLDTLFGTSDDYVAQLSTLVTTQLTKQLGQYADPAMIQSGAGPAKANFENFVLTPQGITFLFDQYAVAPGVAGPQQVTISYEALRM